MRSFRAASDDNGVKVHGNSVAKVPQRHSEESGHYNATAKSKIPRGDTFPQGHH